MKYISMFSGIEAASVAWEPLGWEPVAFCEIEDFPSAVLAHHYPDVPNLHDVTKVDWSEYHGTADLVVGGFPCQSYSVAGLRKGLADPRGELMLEFLHACKEIDPEWVIGENVPGLLSSHGGRDFQTLLEAVAILWPRGGIAWRILDAQFTRVPVRDGDGRVAGWVGPVAQRRRRLFLVINTRDWRRAGAVLFEPESLSGDFASSREKREALARAARGGSATGGGGEVLTLHQNMSGNLHVTENGCGTLMANASVSRQQILVTECCREACLSIDYKQTPKVSAEVCHTLTHEGTGGIHSGVLQSAGFCGYASACAGSIGYQLETAPTLKGNDWQTQVPDVLHAAGFKWHQGARAGSVSYNDELSPTVQAEKQPAVCIQGSMIGRADENGAQGSGLNGDLSFTLNCVDRHAVVAELSAAAFTQNQRNEVRYEGGDGQVVGALHQGSGKNEHFVCQQTDEPVLCRAHSHANAETCEDMSPTITAHNAKDAPIICAGQDVANGTLWLSRCETCGAEVYVSDAKALPSSKAPGGLSECPMCGQGHLDWRRVGHPTDIDDGGEDEIKAVAQGHDADDMSVTIHDGTRWIVRRLTPTECERLQGFPDGWTDIPWGGKEHAPDTRRYKSLGNSMATPCMRYLAERVRLVQQVVAELEAESSDVPSASREA